MGIASKVTQQACFKQVPSFFSYLLSPVLHLLLLNIQLLLLLRATALILARLMLEGMVSTRTPTATWWRRWCSRTSVSPTQRPLAGLRITRNVLQSNTRTALVLLRPV